MTELRAQAILARQAALELATIGAEQKSAALKTMAARLRGSLDAIIEANEQDVADAKSRGMSEAMIDRLMLDGVRVDAMARGMESIAELEDPIGRVDEAWVRPNGLRISRRRVPLGVICLLYTSDAADE